jgi:hypothetical protein
MNGRTRILVWIAVVSVAAAIVVPVAQAGGARPAIKPGCSDFGLVYRYGAGCVPATVAPAKRSAAAGFRWGDAGIGAAAMLGGVLLVVGLGAGLVLSRRQLRST